MKQTQDANTKFGSKLSTLPMVTVFFTSLNLLYYTYKKYWFDEFLPEIQNCTSMCWSL